MHCIPVSERRGVENTRALDLHVCTYFIDTYLELHVPNPRAAPFSFEKEVVLVGIAMHLLCTLD